MTLHRLCRTQILPVRIEQAWQFFSSPLNLPSITPPWLRLTVVSPVPERMFPGMVIGYRVAPFFGLPVTWISEITHVDAPYYFVDTQRVGPYRFWHHRHHFRAVDGGVEMRDVVSYALAYGPLGALIHALLVRRRLAAIFDFRKAALQRRFAG